MPHDPLHASRRFDTGRGGGESRLFSLPALEEQGLGAVSTLPFSIRIVLESVLRHAGDGASGVESVRALANWRPRPPAGERTVEIPFVVSRILLQDFTGVPLLVDLAAMRSAVARTGRDPAIIEPHVPVDLVIDHSVQVDFAGAPDALRRNMEMEFGRNRERYAFLKWGTQGFDRFLVIPPGIGICHQVNLEHLAQVVHEKDGVCFPDTLLGTDSHTTMVNGLGVVGWGVGGIEAEAGMLGQPVYFLEPDVVGVHLAGRLRAGVTAADLVLTITQMLREAKVVGKFVEFHGDGAASLGVPDRASIANMAPEYGATLGFFAVDERTCEYLEATGRTSEHVDRVRRYFAAQGMFGTPRRGDCEYTSTLELDLAAIEPSVAGPKRPQDRIALSEVGRRFAALLSMPVAEGGYELSAAERGRRATVDLDARPAAGAPTAGGGAQEQETQPQGAGEATPQDTSIWTETEMMNNRPTPNVVPAPSQAHARNHVELRHGSVLIAAITSCTHTSNPSAMLAAGLLAKKAVERGLRLPPAVKASLAPGSRVVSDYLTRTGLQHFLDELGFALVGYGCTTCIGNSGPLDPALERAVVDNDLVAASVLSGNRNFEARVHQSLRANFLASPPLVVAFALAGGIDVDLTRQPLGRSRDGEPVYLRDIWPSDDEIAALLQAAFDRDVYRRLYAGAADQNPLWKEIASSEGALFEWDRASTYIREPPYFEGFDMQPPPARGVQGARALAIFGDSVTTDHISPAGAIALASPAGLYLQAQGVQPRDFNSYGARRGNHEVMVRGTFANVRIRNRMVPGVEGGVTVHQPSGERLSIYDASERYRQEGVPLVVVGGREYGTGSSRDWAAKGTRLLGVRAVIAASFERIHRSNLVGMGVLPCQFEPGTNADSLGLDGSEVYALGGMEAGLRLRQRATLVVERAGREALHVPLHVRLDTAIEVDHFRHGGILPFVLRQILAAGARA